MSSRTPSSDSILAVNPPVAASIEDSPQQLAAPSNHSEGPPSASTCLLRAHSLSPSHSKMRPKSRPRSTTATSNPTTTRASSTSVNWWSSNANSGGSGGGSGGGGGLMAMLQRALCSGNGNNQRGQYRTVLTRESPDSGLELDRMEAGNGAGIGPSRNVAKLGDDEENEEEEGEEGEGEEDGKKKPNSAIASPSSSLGRLLSTILARPSLISNSMFDFPSPPPLLLGGPLDPNGYAQSSPISQLSRANGVLMAENQQLANRIEELEHSLRDHVAHLNSVYYTLHQRHGFDALQLPDGELVQLSQFKGPEVVLLTFVGTPPASIIENGTMLQTGPPGQKGEMAAASRRHRLLQQQIRHKQAMNGHGAQQQNGQGVESSSHSPSISGGSSCSFVSASSDSSLDPVEMFHQLCIRPKAELADDDREQIQAYVDWLKSGGGNGEDEEAHRLLAKFRAQQVQAQVQQQLGVNGSSTGQSPSVSSSAASSSSTMLGGGRVHFSSMEEQRAALIKDAKKQLNGWRNARSETASSQAGAAGTTILSARDQGPLARSPVENGHNGQQQLCAQLSEPNRSVSPRIGGGGGTALSKGQRIRTQYPSGTYLQTRRMTHTMGGSYGTSALMSGNHHAGNGCGTGGVGGGREERSPRRGGIGLVSACRNTMRANFEHQRGMNSRNLI